MAENNSYNTTTFEDDDEIELELGLSLGGSVFRKAERSNPIRNDKATKEVKTAGCVKRSGSDTDLRVEGACLDNSLTKRKIHALRRQEAKKKRDAKQQKKRRACNKARDGEITNGVSEEEYCKRVKTEVYGSVNGVNLNLSIDQDGHPNPYPFPYTYQMPQLLSLADGCRNAVPFWSEKEKNIVQPLVAATCFRPYGADQQFTGQNAGNGCEDASKVGEENRKTMSNGSPVCSSSGVSDPNSSSLQGSSFDSGTHSARSISEQAFANNGSVASNSTPSTNQKTACPQQAETAESSDRSNGTTISETEKPSSSNGIATRSDNSISRDNGKPPTPRSQNAAVFPHMPCVTTTGSGPNGKTINGFLYRYSKSEISIICVCHGSSFSPAEFVRHAGGTDVSHPLRHITVIPSAAY